MARIHYIVRTRSESTTLDEFLAALGADPALELLDTIGPQGRPHTAVVAVMPEQAAAFEQRFCNSPQLMIERDRPLSPRTEADGRAPGSERTPHA